MTASRFDRVARLFADRRQAAASAREDAPDATPEAGSATWEKIPYLFVQSFQGGSLTANPATGTHTLTLEQGLGQTVYFSDRPARDVGVTPTPQLLQTLGFSAENPPNAALLVDAGDGESDLAVVELFDPVYDEATHTATYQVRGLEAWEEGLASGLQQESTGLDGIAQDFGTAHLLIDDCADGYVHCTNNSGGTSIWGPFPFCYNYAQCIPCEPYGHSQPDVCATWGYWGQMCNTLDKFICKDTNGGCRASWPWSDWLECPN
jgi:hypothetical protein